MILKFPVFENSGGKGEMNKKIIKRLPLASYTANRTQNCPICGRKTEMYTDFAVELRPLTTPPVISMCGLLYCVYCALPFVNDEIIKKIRADNDGFGIMTFKEDKKMLMERVS